MNTTNMNKFKLALIIAAASFGVLLLGFAIANVSPIGDYMSYLGIIGGVVALVMGGLKKYFSIVGKLLKKTGHCFYMPIPINFAMVFIMFLVTIWAAIFMVIFLPIIPVGLAFLDARKSGDM